MPERWRAISGWEALYEVSDLGRVRSLDHQGRRQFHSGRILKPTTAGQGHYLRVGLHLDRTKVDRYIHHLVLETFVGPRPEGMPHTRHLNGNNHDNRLENLKYGTPSENAADKFLHGTFRTRAFVATECARGHEFSAENTSLDRHGGRHCRTCMRASDREASRRRRARGLPPDDPRHGTVTGYINCGCRCKSCLSAHQDYRQRRKTVAMKQVAA